MTRFASLASALLAAACGGTPNAPGAAGAAAELAAPDCIPHAEHAYASSTVPRVFLEAAGFEPDGCYYSGSLVLQHARGYTWSYSGVRLRFNADGAIHACEYPHPGGCEALIAIERTSPVGGACEAGAVDVRGEPMPSGGCGVAP